MINTKFPYVKLEKIPIIESEI